MLIPMVERCRTYLTTKAGGRDIIVEAVECEDASGPTDEGSRWSVEGGDVPRAAVKQARIGDVEVYSIGAIARMLKQHAHPPVQEEVLSRA